MKTHHMATRDEISSLLQSFSEGDRTALDRLVPLVYDDLRRLARRQDPNAESATSLVHQLYVKLSTNGNSGWENRQHFYNFAAAALRHLVCDRLRRRARESRLDAAGRASLASPVRTSGEDVLTLDAALNRLADLDQRLACIVECRFYGGLTVDETAVALGVSPATVKRGWHTAQAWLYKELHAPREPA